jgi:hypothetical protein
MTIISLKQPSFLKLMMLFLRRIVLNIGPHGKYCKCNKWGLYVGLGCSNPAYKLKIVNID